VSKRDGTMSANAWKCPVCDKPAALGDLELHLALKDDVSHRRWRLNGKLPARITMSLVRLYRKQIRVAIVSALSSSAFTE
jgi:hypothetical protein